MQEKSLNYVSPNWRDLYQKGCATLGRGDFNNAIIVFTQILDEEPGFVECRESLRKAQLMRAQNTGFLKHAIEEMREVPELAEAETLLHSQPLKAIRAAERVLNHVPNSILAHKILAQAALKANMPRTAMLSLDFILSHAHIKLDVTLALADALVQNGQISEAMRLCGRLLKDYPGSRRVTRALSRFYKLAHDSQPNSEPTPMRSRIPLRTSQNYSSSSKVFGRRQDIFKI